MCSVWENAAGLAMAANGRTSVGCPSIIVKPVGVFIHAFAMTTKMPDSTPLRATMMTDARCARGARRPGEHRAAGRRVPPRVRDDDEDAGQHAAQGDDDA